MLTAAFSLADWDNVSLCNETLLDTVSRFVFAALLKHTGLLGQGCGEGRYCSAISSSIYIHTVTPGFHRMQCVSRWRTPQQSSTIHSFYFEKFSDVLFFLRT